MSIRIKSMSLVLAVAGSLAIIASVLAVAIVLRRFNELERNLADRELDSVTETVSAMLKAQRTVALQWSNWTDAYTFMQTGSETFAATNLIPSAVRDSHVTTIAYLDLNGRLIGGVSSRAANQPLFPSNMFTLAPNLLAEIKAGQDQVGLMAIDGVIYSLACMPIHDSDGKGAAARVL